MAPLAASALALLPVTALSARRIDALANLLSEADILASATRKRFGEVRPRASADPRQRRELIRLRALQG